MNNNMDKKILYLDIIRIIAVSLVIYLHVFLCAMNDTTLPNIINNNVELPLLPRTWLTFFGENVLYKTLKLSAGTFGVSLFFIVTGYLMPMMMERYSRMQFIINRFFRIFPLLLVSCLFIGWFLGVTQDIKFSLESYLHSIFLTYTYYHITPITGVLWTLVIENLFYLICAINGKFTFKKFIILNLVLITVCLIIVFSKCLVLESLLHNLRFIFIILIGSAFFLSEKMQKEWHKFLLIFLSSIIAFIMCKYCHIPHNDSLFFLYKKINNIIFIVLIFACLRHICTLNWITKINTSVINFLASLVYPLYLLHIAIGLNCIYYIKSYLNVYIVFIITVVLVFTVAVIAHYLIEKPFIRLGKYLIKKINL